MEFLVLSFQNCDEIKLELQSQNQNHNICSKKKELVLDHTEENSIGKI